jgi:hypothetical protein
VAGGDDADSMLRFRLERGGNEMKCCRKMKRWYQADVGLIGRKRRHDAVRVTMSVREEATPGTKKGMNKIHLVDSAATNEQ